MPYIVNGKIVDQKPLATRSRLTLLSILNTLWFFFASIFSSAPLTEQVGAFETRQRGVSGGGGGRANIHGTAKPAMEGGCGGGG